ncbi:MAG TPA: peptidoglycan-binding protein [Solirubrobacteraceae bacterium]|nr:peptidoglycan-binding protein [Solirubrobacteraceae bacterium]
MKAFGNRRLAVLALLALVGLAVVGWAAAQQIRSPAKVAAETAAPNASPITVPIERRTLATKVIVRGTVRYGAAQAAQLATSKLKQGSDIVTRSPRRRAQLDAGEVAMSVDGRPVFVLPGAIPMHRDLTRGDVGPDVRQLEEALTRFGFSPGRVDGRYDAATGAAVSAFYLDRGSDPFGPTDLQLDQLRTAQTATAQARDSHLQAINAAEQARRGATKAEVEQARADAVTARDNRDTAVLGVASARAKLDTTRSLAANAPAVKRLGVANSQRDQALADTDVEVKRAALNTAVDDERVASMKRFEVPLDAPPSERELAAAQWRQAAEAVGRAQAELNAAIAAASAARAGGVDTVARARHDAAQLVLDVKGAESELNRARRAVDTARRQVTLADQRVQVLRRPADIRTQRAVIASAAQEARRTRGEVARLSAETSVQVPANEILFFPNLPLQVDAIKARRGSTVTGSVMTVTSSRLAVDSSLSVSDRKLVRPGDPVTIEEQDLGVNARGSVGRVSATPGTNRVDPNRFYMSVSPAAGLPSLVGASVKLTISVKSTRGAVLAVPTSALSVGGDGSSRVQVRRKGQTRLVTVVPGLAAEGLVEVRPTGGQRLAPGDLVIVGKGR